MSIPYSKFSQVERPTFGTTLSASGTVLAAPSDGSRTMLDYVGFWLTDPSTSNTVTLTLGSATVPATTLDSSRTGISLPARVLEPETAITVTLSGTASVVFYGQYVTATDE